MCALYARVPPNATPDGAPAIGNPVDGERRTPDTPTMLARRMIPPSLLLAFAASGCDRAPAPAPASSPTLAAKRPQAAPTAVDPLVGRWIGVEGMTLDVAAAGTPGHYALTMQWDLDHRGSFDGIARDGAIAFTRDGVAETLRPTDGAATGLKYLAGKDRCLTVKPGEGYCRA